MTVSQEEKDAMLKLRQLSEGFDLAGAAQQVLATGATNPDGFAQAKAATRASGEEVDAMAKILNATQKFHNPQAEVVNESMASTVMPMTSETPIHQPRIVREHTNFGWGIKSVLNESTGKVKSYQVFHEGLGTVIADNIKLMEAANKIMQLLNEGVTINDKRMSKVLYLEHDYKDNAIKTKKLKPINESKSNTHRLRCLQIKEEISKI